MCSESSSTDPQTQPPQCRELCGYFVVWVSFLHTLFFAHVLYTSRVR